MNKSNGMNKGEHEKSMEKAKEKLDRGCGLSQVVAETNLKEEDVLKAKKKWVDQS